MLGSLVILSLVVVSGYAQCPGCGTYAPRDNYCAADVTIAIDFTPDMGSQINVYDFISQNYSNLFPLSVQYVNAVILGYGLTGFKKSDVLYSYTDFCAQIQDQCRSYTSDGSSSYSLSDLFKFYDVFYTTVSRAGIPSKFVVFTATNNQTDVQLATPYAANVTNLGAEIIIVGINQQSQTLLKQLSQNVYFVNASQLVNNGDLTNYLLNQTCTFDLTTPAPASTTPASTDVTGTPCSVNIPGFYLDIIIAIDYSFNMGTDFTAIVASLQALFYNNFTISQSGGQSSRVGIILFDSNVTIYADLTTYSSLGDLQSGLKALLKIKSTKDPYVDISLALQTAQDMFSNSNSGNPQVVFLISSTFHKGNAELPCQVAGNMKDEGVFFIAFDYNDPRGIAASQLKCIASRGQYYNVSDPSALLTEVPLGFAAANCVCPSSMVQVVYVNNETNSHGQYFADCLNPVIAGSYWQFAEDACEGSSGVLVSVTSPMKKDFILNNILYSNPSLLPGQTRFHIGLHNVNGARNWNGYNGTYPLGAWQDWAPGFANSSPGDCVFYDQYGNGWGWETEACAGSNAWSYICQSRACDASNYCNPNSFNFRFRRN